MNVPALRSGPRARPGDEQAYRHEDGTFCDITSAELFDVVPVLAYFRFSNSFSVSSPIFSDMGRGSSVYALMLLCMWSISLWVMFA